MEANKSKHSNNKTNLNSSMRSNISKMTHNKNDPNKSNPPTRKPKKQITLSVAWNELKSSPKDLYLIFILKFLESYSYFAIIYTLIIFLSDEYKYTDEEAGWSYGLFGMCTSIYGFIFGGFLIDNLGVRLSLCLGCSILFVGRLLLVISTSHIHILIILYTILPIGTCLGIPVMQIGIRRYTTENCRSLAYSIFYGMMNVSAIFSASSIDFCRRYLVDKKIDIMGIITFELTAYRTLFLFGVVTTFISLLVSLCLNDHDHEEKNENGAGASDGGMNSGSNQHLEESEMNKNNNLQNEEEGALLSKNNSITLPTSKNINYFDNSTITNSTNPNISNNNLIANSNNSIKNGLILSNKYNANTGANGINKKKIVGPLEIIKEVTSQKSFWKFVYTIILLMGVRIVYRHLDATFPKYMIREFGKEIMYGSIIAINPFLIVILLPVFAPLSYQFSAYTQITFGAFLTAISPFFLVLGSHLWSSVMFVVILSIGEALWSPRLYEYTIFITEKGREGIYMALASSPMFVATLFTGATSGIFLETYCPEKGPRESWKMWLIIGMITLTSPIFLILLKSKIEITEEELNQELVEREKKRNFEDEALKNNNEENDKYNQNNSRIQVNFNHFNSNVGKFSPSNLVISNNIEFDIKVFQIEKQQEFTMLTPAEKK